MRIPSLEASFPLEGEHVTPMRARHDVRPYTGIKITRATLNTVQDSVFSGAYQTVFSQDHHSGITAVASISTFAAFSINAETSSTLITG
jgi:hypothetical protein